MYTVIIQQNYTWYIFSLHTLYKYLDSLNFLVEPYALHTKLSEILRKKIWILGVNKYCIIIQAEISIILLMLKIYKL